MQCTNPIHLRGAVYPCGKCLSCRIGKAREWSARLIHELNYWSSAVFITLTYSDRFLPKNQSLVKSDLQKFFKRLRKSLGCRKIKYYACGEYGSKTNRPHYHAIIFGLSSSKSDKEIIKDCWRFCEWYNFQDKKAFGTVTYDSCRYVADYIFKKYDNKKCKEVYGDKQPPFKVCSQGLGLRYALNEKDNLIAHMGFTLHGSKMALPRYYVKKLGLKLDDKSNENFEKWKNYARNHHFCDSDMAEIIESHARQRNLTAEARINLHGKGVF